MARAKLDLEFDLPREQTALEGAVMGAQAADTLMALRHWLDEQQAGSTDTEAAVYAKVTARMDVISARVARRARGESDE